MLSVKQGGIKYHFFGSLVWLNLGLNTSRPDHWRTLYSWPGSVIVYYFQIWNKKECNIIIRVNSSHMGPMYIWDTLYIKYNWLCGHLVRVKSTTSKTLKLIWFKMLMCQFYNNCYVNSKPPLALRYIINLGSFYLKALLSFCEK